MALTIVADVGGASSNSFVTRAEFSAHLEGRLNVSAVTDDAEMADWDKALVEATRELSARPWQGRRVTGTQALSWPRQWAPDPDSPIQDYYAITVIPDRVKRATFELAIAFIKAGTTDIAALDETLQIKSKKVDVLETEYVEGYQRVRGLDRYPAVMREIRCLLSSAGGLNTPVVRG